MGVCSLDSLLILVSKSLGGGGMRRVLTTSRSQTTPSSRKPSQHTHKGEHQKHIMNIYLTPVESYRLHLIPLVS